MKARHQNGRIVDANEIADGDLLKPGPWFCHTPGCPVRYGHHRVASYAVDGSQRVLRSGTFAHGGDRSHLTSCSLNLRAQKQRLLAAHPGVFTSVGDKLLLRWGGPVRKERFSVDPPVRRAATTRETYAAVMEAAIDVTGVIDRSGGDEGVLNAYWVVHRGIRYTWADFCYGSAAASLARLAPSLAQAFNEAATGRPRFVRAQVADAAIETNSNRGRLKLRFRATDTLADGRYVRGWLFGNSVGPAADALRDLRNGDRFCVLGDNWFRFGDIPALNVDNLAQISPMPV
ncbi:hypothetical protein [Microbacterium sp. Leaf151]|uniref:hypothetical protein n=1 Tax=Microbacterium sp. Leaf151 TaxID=1736276 RepID=UPI000AAA2D0B|nr:hypothetical protein [Microbacterium sp. Leaf151]